MRNISANTTVRKYKQIKNRSFVKEEKLKQKYSQEKKDKYINEKEKR